MKVGMVGTSLLISALLAGGAFAQTIPSPVAPQTPQTVEAAQAIEDPAARINALQQILKTRPATEQSEAARESIVASWAQLGEAQLSDNNIERAAANFRKALASLPEKVTDQFFADTVIRIPLAASVRGYRTEAIELARLLETRFAKEKVRLAALGEFFMTVEAPTDAIRALEAALKLAGEESEKPDGDAPLHRALGAAYRMGLQLDDAISEFQQAIGANPKDKLAYYELANLYRAHGAYGDAIKLYQKQLEVEPKHAPALKGLALAYLAQGNETRMTAALNQARDLRGSAEEITGDIYLQTQMAFYYLKQGRLKQARAAAEAALVVEPRYAWARIAAAEVDLAENKVFEAERNLLAAQRYASFPTLFFTLGKLYLSVEDFDGALEQFSKAFQYSTTEQFTTRLGGSLDVRADGVKELLSREHQASIFIAESPTLAEQYKLAESLVRFQSWLEEIKTLAAKNGTGKTGVTRKQMEELDRAAMDFVEAESTRRAFRSLYIAQRLSQTGIATGLAIELAEQALGLAEAATQGDGSVRDYPNYDRGGRLQIFRGRALDAKGWAQYKAGQTEEAATTLEESVKAYGTLSEGKQATWHLAIIKESAGDLKSALDLYLAGYQPPAASTADMKLAVIEVLYRKIHGSRDGLEEQLRKALGISLAEANAMLNVSSRRQIEPVTGKGAAPAKSQSKRGKPSDPIGKKDAPAAAREDLRAGAPVKSVGTPEPPAAVKQPPAQAQEEAAAPAGSKELVKEVAKEAVTTTGLPAEAPTVTAQPVELPDIPLASSQPVVPMPFDMQALVSIGELVITTPAADENVPPPPVQTHTRPRRVAAPKGTTPPQSQEPSLTEPIRLRRPPKPNQP